MGWGDGREEEGFSVEQWTASLPSSSDGGSSGGLTRAAAVVADGHDAAAEPKDKEAPARDRVQVDEAVG